MLRQQFVGIFLCVAAAMCGALATPSFPQFDPVTRTIKVLQFTDLHFGEGVGKDNHSIRIEENLLDLERPDLVILTGDMISGYAWDRTQHPWFTGLFERLITPIEERGIRWMYVMGNHDNQGDLTDRNEIMRFAETFPHSLSRPGPTNVTGSSNYAVPILSSSGNGSAAAVMWAMDTGDNNCLGIQGWDCVYPDQIEWFRDTNRGKWSQVPGMMWMHIPVHEMMSMWNFRSVKGRLEDVGVCCPSANTGLWSAAKEAGNIVSMAFGHDHSNDYIGDYHGITLAYGRKTGVGGYGPPPDMQRGARVWVLREPPANQPLNLTFTTWIRRENGSVSFQNEHDADPSDRYQVCCDAQLVAGQPYQPQLPMCERYAREWQLKHFGEIRVRQFVGSELDPVEKPPAEEGRVRIARRD